MKSIETVVTLLLVTVVTNVTLGYISQLCAKKPLNRSRSFCVILLQTHKHHLMCIIVEIFVFTNKTIFNNTLVLSRDLNFK